MIDSHSHLMMLTRSPADVLADAKKKGVSAVINVAIDLKSARQALDTNKQFKNAYPTVGVHPCHSNEPINWDEYKSLAKSEPVVAIGEIGLDYYRDYSPKEVQARVFETQLDIAQELGLPVIIHNRHADDDTLAILKKRPGLKFVFHCFSSNWEIATQVLELGGFLSFTGLITFSKKGKTINVVKKMPLDRMMIETDCPYLKPKDTNAKENEPQYLPEISKKIAAVREINSNELNHKLTQNTTDFFNI